MGLLTVTCNPAKNCGHNSLLCLGSAGMQHASRARDGKALTLSCPILEYIKTAGRKPCREKMVGKKLDWESSSVMTLFYLITTGTPLFSLISFSTADPSKSTTNLTQKRMSPPEKAGTVLWWIILLTKLTHPAATSLWCTCNNRKKNMFWVYSLLALLKAVFSYTLKLHIYTHKVRKNEKKIFVVPNHV